VTPIDRPGDLAEYGQVGGGSVSENLPFADPENVAVFILKRILRGGSPVPFVTQDEGDGGWQFLDGGEDSVKSGS
jgi:hypothetical protein